MRWIHLTRQNKRKIRRVWELYRVYLFPAIQKNTQDTYFSNTLDGRVTIDLFDEDYSFDGPVLLINGRQDSVVGYIDQFRLLEHYPNGSYVALKGAGHNIWIDQYDMFHEMTASWIKKYFISRSSGQEAES